MLSLIFTDNPTIIGNKQDRKPGAICSSMLRVARGVDTEGGARLRADLLQKPPRGGARRPGTCPLAAGAPRLLLCQVRPAPGHPPCVRRLRRDLHLYSASSSSPPSSLSHRAPGSCSRSWAACSQTTRSGPTTSSSPPSPGAPGPLRRLPVQRR